MNRFVHLNEMMRYAVQGGRMDQLTQFRTNLPEQESTSLLDERCQHLPKESLMESAS